MEVQISQVVVYLICAAIVGLVGAVAKLWHEFNAHRIHVAESYVRHPELTKMEVVMTDIQHQLGEILKIVYELKGAAGGK